MTRTYFAIGCCQHTRSCGAAKFGDSRSHVCSPEFSNLDLVKHWLAGLYRHERLCRNCLRPISPRKFAFRYFDVGALYSYAADETEIPMLGWWPDGLEREVV
jgi:hypothetical protein